MGRLQGRGPGRSVRTFRAITFAGSDYRGLLDQTPGWLTDNGRRIIAILGIACLWAAFGQYGHYGDEGQRPDQQPQPFRDAVRAILNSAKVLH